MAIIIRRCTLADKEHKASERQYAHTYHSKNVICVAGAWVMLPLQIEMALVAHELGHLLAGHGEHEEEEADRLGNKFFDVTIKYKDTLYGKRLQYVTHRDAMKIYNWVLDNVTFEGKLFA